MSSLKIFPNTYFGSKFYLRKKILPHIPDFDKFVEPFGGSAEISLQLMLHYKNLGQRKTFIINDFNTYVILFHAYMKYYPDLIKEKIKRLTKPEFLELRSKEQHDEWDIFNLWFNCYQMYMSFRKCDGKFSRPWGNKFSFKPDKIDLCHELYNYHDVHFFNKNYKELDYSGDHTFVYLDPPYQQTFVQYSSPFCWEEFENFLKNLNKKWLLSTNLHCQLGKEVEHVQITSGFSRKTPKEKRDEYLFEK
ncbi:MAG: DNA adenine methylase [Methanobrevibacter sp.]|jgi:site-specific DNA-adenine methylase|nr:DNA adenine methylase [Candidatus Methanovirga australis]